MQDTTVQDASSGRLRVEANRRAAVSAGDLLIAATVASLVGTGLSRPFVDDPDYLRAVSGHVSAGALLELVAAAASAGIAISLYPVLRDLGPRLALGSAVFRTAEAVMYMVAAACLLAVLTLGERFGAAAGAADPGTLRSIGDSLLDVREQVTLIGVFAFSVGAFCYYALFYRSALIPRWLSGWGIVAIVLTVVACLLALFNWRPLTTYTIVLLPIAVQEMVLAVWLIAKGFAPGVPTSDVGSGIRG
jgi:hypothetical protein